MPFTGQLGTADSQLGNVELGATGGGGRTTAGFTSRARILRVETAGFTSRARITFGIISLFTSRAAIRVTSTVGFTSRARILRVETPQFTSRARITLGFISLFTSRARIKAQTTTTLPVDFKVVETVTAYLPVLFNVSAAVREYATFTSRARVRAIAEARLSVDFTIDYAVPTTCVLRPTQRTTAPAVLSAFYSRARIGYS